MTPEEYVASIPMWAVRKNTLPEIRRFLAALGIPDAGGKTVHIAGTNGKGSVSAFLTRALTDRGLHTGTFVSPHLTDVKERILLDGQPVSADDFAAAVRTVRETAESLQGSGFLHPTYFEFLFYTAMVVFDRKAPDYLILETGLGGRLDATTAVLPVLSVITSISMDHMKYLGDTIEKIAAEKAGIIMPGVPVVYDRNSAAAEAVILRKAAGCGSRAYGVSPDEGERRFAFLRVPYMRENAAVARQAFLLLGFADDGAFEKAAAATYWAGRMDEIEPGVFLDGAHNADGIRAFAEAAADILQRRQKTAVLLISAVSDKDIASMCTEIGRHLQPARVYTARLSDSRAADEDVIAGNLRRALGCTVTEKGTVHEAFASALAGRSGDEILFCTGSLYLVGELLKERKEIK